ncbi:hypothetical protein AGMMS49992_16240 [Clostridia bacterium]|nr:hypothetical protein AGMMS49992_16240 [Clostridia bacterium]
MLLSIPMRTLLFAFVPLPWMVFSLETLLAFLMDSTLQVFVWVRVWRIIRIRECYQPDERSVMWLFLILIVGSYMFMCLGATAYGNVIRHRVKVMPITICFVVAYYEYLKEKYASAFYNSKRRNHTLAV